MAESKVIAVDLGGTSIRVGLLNGRKILRLVTYPTLADKGKDVVLRQLINAIEEAKGNEKIKGIGVGSPGPLLNGVVKNPPNLPFRNFDLKNFLKKKFKTRVEIENDAKCAALAELNYGVRKKNFIVLTLGTGIGGGIIVNGKLYVGEGYGGEMGHIVIQDKNDLEYWASGSTITRNSKKIFGEKLLAGQLRRMKNKRADKILEEAASKLAMGIGSLVNVFDPEVVVLVGGLKDAGKKYFNIVKRDAKKYSILPKKINIQWSKLKNPGVLGAALLLKKK